MTHYADFNVIFFNQIYENLNKDIHFQTFFLTFDFLSIYYLQT